MTQQSLTINDVFRPSETGRLQSQPGTGRLRGLPERQPITLQHILRQPETLEELGVPTGVVIDLMLRMLFVEGDVSLKRFSEVLRIGAKVIDSTLLRLQQEHIVDIAKAGNIGRASYIYALTEAGVSRARDALERSQYIGPVPVPLELYNQAIVLQTQNQTRFSADTVQKALQHLVLPDDFHLQIGPAITAGTSLFLYGPSGNGKTTVAQAIAGLIASTEPIWLPAAVTIVGQ